MQSSAVFSVATLKSQDTLDHYDPTVSSKNDKTYLFWTQITKTLITSHWPQSGQFNVFSATWDMLICNNPSAFHVTWGLIVWLTFKYISNTFQSTLFRFFCENSVSALCCCDRILLVQTAIWAQLNYHVFSSSQRLSLGMIPYLDHLALWTTHHSLGQTVWHIHARSHLQW